MEYCFRPIDNWPQQKTRNPRQSQFRTRYSETLNLLDRELCFLRARNIVFQIDLPESQIRLDGLPRSGARPEYQGVIVSFDSKFGPLRYLTDVFNNWQDNLRAIALGLEALRKVDRYGITKRGEQYAGWKALPGLVTAITTRTEAAEFLSKHGGGRPDDIQSHPEILTSSFRVAALKLHPDKGGDAKMFELLQQAKKILTA